MVFCTTFFPGTRSLPSTNHLTAAPYLVCQSQGMLAKHSSTHTYSLTLPVPPPGNALVTINPTHCNTTECHRTTVVHPPSSNRHGRSLCAWAMTRAACLPTSLPGDTLVTIYPQLAENGPPPVDCSTVDGISCDSAGNIDHL